MKILALELSSSLGSISFRRDGEELFVRQFPADRKDSGFFYENLAALREACGLPELIVVGLGPGSYAGVRIALATALGLRAASSARLVGWPSVCAFAANYYCVIGDARRASYFFAVVRQGECVEGPILMSEKELQTKLTKENESLPLFAAEKLASFREAALAFPSASRLAQLAESGKGSSNLEPIYLRLPYITTAKAKSWNR